MVALRTTLAVLFVCLLALPTRLVAGDVGADTGVALAQDGEDPDPRPLESLEVHCRGSVLAFTADVEETRTWIVRTVEGRFVRRLDVEPNETTTFPTANLNGSYVVYDEERRAVNTGRIFVPERNPTNDSCPTFFPAVVLE